jgi:hypothetical protein
MVVYQDSELIIWVVLGGIGGLVALGCAWQHYRTYIMLQCRQLGCTCSLCQPVTVRPEEQKPVTNAQQLKAMKALLEAPARTYLVDMVREIQQRPVTPPPLLKIEPAWKKNSQDDPVTQD